MAKYAVVKIGGVQYKLAEGEEHEVAKIAGEKGKAVSLNEVLLLVDDEKVQIGQPFVAGAKIKAKILSQYKGEKIRVAKYHAKTFRRTKGFRSRLTSVKILDIMA